MARAGLWLPLVAAWVGGGFTYLHEPLPGEMLSAVLGTFVFVGVLSALTQWLSLPYRALHGLSAPEISQALEWRDKAGVPGEAYFQEVTCRRGLVRADLTALRCLADKGLL